MFDIVISTLGVYGISVLLAEYSGPKNIFLKLREKGLPDCVPCLSVYIAIIPVLSLSMSFFEYLAIIGATIIIERII